MAVGAAKKFLRNMAQPFKPSDQEGISTWSIQDLEKFKEKQEEESIRALREAQAAHNKNAMHGIGNGNEETVAAEDEFGFDDDELEESMMALDDN
jgi:DNA excision repair protein ERCC-2